MIAQIPVPEARLADGDSYIILSKGFLSMHLDTIRKGISGIGVINELLNSSIGGPQDGAGMLDNVAVRSALHESIELLCDRVSSGHDGLFFKICEE